MSTVRRWYIYLVATISLQSVVWAIIALARQLLLSQNRLDPEMVAFQLAVIIIGLPIFLIHWLWSQRLARAETGEKQASLRYLYLYGNLAGLFIPILTNSFDLLGTLLRASGTLQRQPATLSAGWALVYHLIPILVLAGLGYYHWLLVSEAITAPGEKGYMALIRRAFILGFSGAGVTLLVIAIINLVSWILHQFGGGEIISAGSDNVLASEITRVLIGLPLWLWFWLWAGRLFSSGGAVEKHSALRKFYLYAAIFIGTLSVVGTATILLQGLFRRLLSLPVLGDSRMAVAVIVGMGLLWGYHSFVLRAEDEAVAEQPRQAGIRRLYYYLVAGIGLTALLVGLAGEISVWLRALDDGFIASLRDQLALFSAAIIAGLAVWFWPWRQLLRATADAAPLALEERRSVVRRIYLYLFLFAGTMTILGGAIFIVYRLLTVLLSDATTSVSELGNAVSFSLIAVAVLVYHGGLLRADGQRLQANAAAQLKALRVAFVGTAGAPLTEQLQAAYTEAFAGAKLLLLDPGGAAMPAETVAGLDLVVAPVGATAGNAPLAAALAAAPGRKLLLPLAPPGWEWVGVDKQAVADTVKETVHAIEQVMAGEELSPHRPFNPAAIIGSIIVGFILLNLVIALISFLIEIIGF